LLTSRRSRWGLRTIALTYLALLLLAPVAVVFVKTFEHGFGVAWAWMTTPAAVSALWLSIVMALIAVPLNTIFGISTALVLVRGRAAHPRLTGILDTLIDLPFLVSPVIIGLALTLVYGIHGWFGAWFAARGVQIIFAPAGMVLATVFVSLPFVVREVVPVLVEIGDDQEQAASTLGASRWQTFRRVTFPSIRWGVAYGSPRWSPVRRSRCRCSSTSGPWTSAPPRRPATTPPRPSSRSSRLSCCSS
jgi:sulfate transport system permease protein